MKKHKQAEVKLLQALKIFEQLSNEKSIEHKYYFAATLSNIGQLYLDLQDSIESEKYLLLALDKYKKLGAINAQHFIPLLVSTLKKVSDFYITISPSRSIIYLGLNQLLNNDYYNAQITYQKLKGKKDDEGKDYKQRILDDLKALEAEGITHKDIGKMKAEIEKW